MVRVDGLTRGFMFRSRVISLYSPLGVPPLLFNNSQVEPQLMFRVDCVSLARPYYKPQGKDGKEGIHFGFRCDVCTNSRQDVRKGGKQSEIKPPSFHAVSSSRKSWAALLFQILYIVGDE